MGCNISKSELINKDRKTVTPVEVKIVRPHKKALVKTRPVSASTGNTKSPVMNSEVGQSSFIGKEVDLDIEIQLSESEDSEVFSNIEFSDSGSYCYDEEEDDHLEKVSLPDLFDRSDSESDSVVGGDEKWNFDDIMVPVNPLPYYSKGKFDLSNQRTVDNTPVNNNRKSNFNF